ncbi:head GIN domain-containing protein [Pedobacter nototheniae]|uniref:head GIN domain-containing protein n=1 Tax=Pedobacter nototheniae TaxID=2488994 RepID=UPI00292D81CB|nr:head GIN domain-containing protein [Pedobacter nototheniae]
MRTITKSSAFLFLIAISSYFAKAQDNKNVAVKSFNSITVSSGIDLYLTQGGSESLNIKADAEVLKNIVVEQNGGNLTIKMKDGISWGGLFKNQVIKAYVHYKNLNALTASGGSDVFTEGTMKADKISIRSSGGSDIKLNLVCNDLTLQSSGGSDVDLKGKAENLSIQASGGSDIDAYEFIAEYAKVTASGGSDVNISVNKGLEAGASGGADVHFKGNASLKKTSSSKSGEVKRVN